MSNNLEEIKNNEKEVVENISTTAKEKPYKFKDLGFDDIFPMIDLINKIGLDNVLGLLADKSLLNLIQGKKPVKVDNKGNVVFEKVKDEEGNEILVEAIDNEKYILEVGKAVTSIVKLILNSLGTCKKELYTVLSTASNLSVEEISKLPIKYIPSMIKDFIKKEDFKDFFSEVLEFMKM